MLQNREYVSSYKFRPIPMASVATITLQGWSGSLNFFAWASLAPGGSPKREKRY